MLATLTSSFPPLGFVSFKPASAGLFFLALALGFFVLMGAICGAKPQLFSFATLKPGL
jgi:hypothetical protein